VAISNHYRLKGHHRIIDSFKQANIPNSSLFIIGNRVNGNPLRGCYVRCKLLASSDKRITLVENAERADVLRFFKRADVLLHSSSLECAPLTIYESMAAGTPFITTWVGNVMELPGGLVVHDNDEMSWMLNVLMRNDDIRIRMAKEGKQYWEKHSNWDRIIQVYERKYRDLIESR